MSENVRYGEPASGVSIACDEIAGGVRIQRVKSAFGADGVAVDVHADQPLPVALAAAADAAGGVVGRAQATAEPITIKSGPGRLLWLHASHANPRTCFAQLFNGLAAGVTVGVTPPTLALAIPPGDGAAIHGQTTVSFPIPAEFSVAIALACAGTPTGSDSPAVPINVNWECR